MHGAYIYLFTAFFQEFLARGVIQTSVKSLMKVKYQKQISIFLTSLLFSLMHLPFGFVVEKGIGNIVEFEPGVYATPIEESVARKIIAKL